MHGFQLNQQVIQENSSSYVQNQNFSRDRVEKTKFQVMAEVNAMQTLVSAALQQAYTYQTYEYYELLRRFFVQNSRDVDVKEFRVRCLKRGVPENMLIPEAWEIEPERVMGAGNKTMEMAIAQQLMEWRSAFSPASQQTILRNAVLAITDDPAMADRLVPESANQISHSKESAMLAIGTLMEGGLVQFAEDKNRIELIDTLLAEMSVIVARLKQTGQPTASEVTGLQNVGMHIGQLVQSIAGDEANQERAKSYGNLLGQLMNEVKALAQMVPQQGNGEMDGKMMETLGKIQAQKITAEAKAANTRESHAQRTGQRQVAWDMQQEQKEQQHQLDMRRQVETQQVEDVVEASKTLAEIKRENAKAIVGMAKDKKTKTE